MKNKRGGKRAGAGRPKDPNSIRSQLAQAKANRNKHTYTMYEARCESFIQNHVPEKLASLYALLSLAPDRSTRALNTRGKAKTHLSLNAQCQLVRLDETTQFEYLKSLLPRFIDQYDRDDAPDSFLRERAKQFREWMGV